MKSPTNNSKISLEDTYVNITGNQSKSPPRISAPKNSVVSMGSVLDEETIGSVFKLFDNELKEITELEIMLNKIKNFEQMKLPFSAAPSSNSTQTSQNSKSNSKQNILVKKKYQILNSVTIDLINNTTVSSSNSVERSKSKKGK